ncbi:MAG: beta galactosidase jelly roll domain-containing protein, partial [Terriglobia bacterium]
MNANEHILGNYSRVTCKRLRSVSKAKTRTRLVQALVLVTLSSVNWLFRNSAQAQTLVSKASVEQSSATVLSGSDWRLGSFPIDQGEQHNVFLENFDDSRFTIITVPGEVQLQLGYQGMDLYYQTKDLAFINEKEWWYRKRFTVPSGDAGKLMRLQFDGVDYFASVWLNGKKLGDHEGCFVPFSFDVSSHLNYGSENLLAVKVTCPWLPKGRSFLEYMKGEWMMNDLSGIRFPSAPYIAGPRYANTPAYGNATFPMGLWRDVKLVASGSIVIEDLFVRTRSLNTDGSATLAISGI